MPWRAPGPRLGVICSPHAFAASVSHGFRPTSTYKVPDDLWALIEVRCLMSEDVRYLVACHARALHHHSLYQFFYCELILVEHFPDVCTIPMYQPY